MSAPRPIVTAAQVLVGTVARIRFYGIPGPGYVAEVRTDFARPQWFGSWHGFALPSEDRVVIVSPLTETALS